MLFDKTIIYYFIQYYENKKGYLADISERKINQIVATKNLSSPTIFNFFRTIFAIRFEIKKIKEGYLHLNGNNFGLALFPNGQGGKRTFGPFIKK